MSLAMNAMVLRAPAQLGLERVERPTPGPDDVLLRITYGGVCGTDLGIYAGKMPAALTKLRVASPRSGVWTFLRHVCKVS